MFKPLITGLTTLSLLGHALWGCCEHHRHACDHPQFIADHDTLVSDCHQHDRHEGDTNLHPGGPAEEESHHPVDGCEGIRCVYIGPDANVGFDLPIATTWKRFSPDESLVVSAGSTTPSPFFMRDVSPPAQRRHAHLQHWLI